MVLNEEQWIKELREKRGCYIMLNTDVLNDVMFQRGKVLEYE